MEHNYEFTCEHCQTKSYINNISEEQTGKDMTVECHSCKEVNVIHLEPPDNIAENFSKILGLSIILFIIGMILPYFGFFDNCQEQKIFFRPFCVTEGIYTNIFDDNNEQVTDQELSDIEDIKISPNTQNEKTQEDITFENDLHDKKEESIVFVKYSISGKQLDGSYFESSATGSGVIASNENNELTIFTNRHVVDCGLNDECFQRISEKIEVRTQDGEIHDVDSVSFSESDVDLAILKVKNSNSDNYQAASYSSHFEINDKVIAIGYPDFGIDNMVEFSVSEGTITNIKDVVAQSSSLGFRVIDSDAYTYFGSSGGGLFDQYGNLIGINTWISSEGSIAIDFSSISEDEFEYCEEGYLGMDGYCYSYCSREQVRGDEGRCYDICDEFLCESTLYDGNDPQCSNGKIAGNDGYCHTPCESPYTYCPDPDSFCYHNDCVGCEYGTHLFKDGTCRLNE